MNTLKRCRKLMIRIINKTDRRDVLFTRLGARAIRYQHDLIQVSPTDKYTEILTEVADLDADIMKLRIELRQLRMKALDQIDRLTDVKHRYVLRLYYTEWHRAENGRMEVYTADEISDMMNYSIRHVYRIIRYLG